MTDMQTLQPSLAAALRSRGAALRPAPTLAASAPDSAEAALVPVPVAERIIEVTPEAAPRVEVDPQVLALAMTAAMERMEQTITRVLTEKTEHLIQEGKVAERSQMRLNDSLGRAVKANPEAIAMLEAENKRHLGEIQRLQSELDRTRRAMRGIVGGGMRSFWRSMGRNLGEAATECFDLLDVAPFLPEGQVTPEVGKRLAALLRSLGGDLEAYADNCQAYAEDADAE